MIRHSRSLVTALTLLALGIPATAQAQEARAGLAFGGAGVAFTSLGDRAAYAIGGSGGEYLTEHFSVGVGGFGLRTRDIDEAGTRLQGGVGGITFAVHLPTNFVELTAGSLIGIGDFERYDVLDAQATHTLSFVAQPTVAAYLPFASHLRAGIEVAWRDVSGARLAGIPPRDFSGGSVMVKLEYAAY